jgi:flavorubredoxin
MSFEKFVDWCFSRDLRQDEDILYWAKKHGVIVNWVEFDEEWNRLTAEFLDWAKSTTEEQDEIPF